MPMTRWAIFDIDGTLFPGGSLERCFMQRMRRNRILPPKRMARFLIAAAQNCLSGKPGQAFRANKTYLTGLEVAAIREAADIFVYEDIIPGLAAEGLQKIARLRGKGYRILLLSGAPDFLAEPLSSSLQVDFLICTRLEVVQQRFTGRIRGIHPYGIAKRQLLLDVAPRLEIDFHHSRVFANHHSDAHHMRRFGSATAVNPTRRLRRIAQQERWEVVYWR